MPGDYDQSHAIQAYGPPGYPGSTGPTGAPGPPGPSPDAETVRQHAREQVRFVVLDLLAGADMEFLKPVIREIVKEELQAAGVIKGPTHDKDGKCLHRDAVRTPTHDEDGTWHCFGCNETY